VEKGGDRGVVEIMAEEQQEMRLIPTALAQAVVNYLGTRPYKEVCEIVPQMLQLPLAPVQAEKADVTVADMQEQ
jgi:hypothetical protein